MSNRIYLREVGFIITPPIAISNLANAYSALTGSAKVVVKQGKVTKIEKINISTTGWSASPKGIWSQVIFRYKPLGGVFCISQYSPEHCYPAAAQRYRYTLPSLHKVFLPQETLQVACRRQV